MLDTMELLFSALPNQAVVRGELGRLFRWLKDNELTTVITGERGNVAGQLTRFGIEEYVSDCVVVLDHRVTEELSTRRLRVTKYRGSVHGTNEYPFLITSEGIVVVPITSMALEHEASDERITSGIPQLDEMMGGGIYRGSTAMVSGSAGTGKTSIAAAFAQAGCERGERVLFVSFEESPGQLIRNMSSIGLDLRRWIDEGLLRIESVRPTAFGLEEHLAMLHRLVHRFDPQIVVLDAIGSMGRVAADPRHGPGHLPRRGPAQEPRDHRVADHLGATPPAPRRARSTSPRSSTPGCCCATTRATASATG